MHHIEGSQSALESAARTIGCSEDEGEDRQSVLPWILGCIGFWLLVALAVWS